MDRQLYSHRQSFSRCWHWPTTGLQDVGLGRWGSIIGAITLPTGYHLGHSPALLLPYRQVADVGHQTPGRLPGTIVLRTQLEADAHYSLVGSDLYTGVSRSI